MSEELKALKAEADKAGEIESAKQAEQYIISLIKELQSGHPDKVGKIEVGYEDRSGYDYHDYTYDRLDLEAGGISVTVSTSGFDKIENQKYPSRTEHVSIGITRTKDGQDKPDSGYAILIRDKKTGKITYNNNANNHLRSNELTDEANEAAQNDFIQFAQIAQGLFTEELKHKDFIEDPIQAEVMATAEKPKREEIAELNEEIDYKIATSEHYPTAMADVDINYDEWVKELRGLQQEAEKLGEDTGEKYVKVKVLAAAFHEAWRAPRKLEDGRFEPRIKVLLKTADGTEKWFDESKIPEGSEEISRVDIANTSYDDLPNEWQLENRKAAETVQGLLEVGLDMKLSPKVINSDKFIERAAEIIHKAWLSRNKWAEGEIIKDNDGNPKKNTRTGEDAKYSDPYNDLPDDEKKKDRDQILTAIAIEMAKK